MLCRGALGALLLFAFFVLVYSDVIQFSTSLPLNVVQAKALISGARLAFDTFNASPKIGYLANDTLTLDARDDNYNPTLLSSNINNMITEQNTTGILFSAGVDYANIIARLLNKTNIPFINPCSSSEALSIPFQRKIINFRPTYSDEMFSLISFLVVERKFQRISVIYDSENTKSFLVLSRYMVSKSLHLVEPLKYERGSTSSDPCSAVRNMIRERPQAVIMLVPNEDAFRFHSCLIREIPELYFMVPRTQSFSSLQNSTLGTSSLFTAGVNYTLYQSDFYPQRHDSNLSLVMDYNRDSTAFPESDSVVADSPFRFEGYITGRWIIRVLQMIDKHPITSEDFINAVYSNQVFSVRGFISGPLVQDEGQFLSQCNKVIHTSYISRLSSTSQSPYVSYTQLDDISVSWRTCEPQFEARNPVQVGFVYDDNETLSIRVIKGMELAFKILSNSKPPGIKAPVEVISYPKRGRSTYDATEALIREYNNTAALVGFSEESALELINSTFYSDVEDFTKPMLMDPLSALTQTIREPFNPFVLTTNLAVKDCVISTLYYLRSSANMSATNRSKNGQVNFAIYYEPNDKKGVEFFNSVNTMIERLKVYDDNNQVPLSNTKYKNKLRFLSPPLTPDNLYSASTRDQLRSYQTDGTPIDYLLVCSENIGYVVNVTELLNTFQPTNAAKGRAWNTTTLQYDDIPHMEVITMSPWVVAEMDQAVTNAQKAHNYITTAYYGIAGNTTGAFPRDIQLWYQYVADSRSIDGPDSDNVAGFSGYLTGMAIGEIINNIPSDDVINPSTFIKSVYGKDSPLEVYGMLLGPYTYSNLESNLSNYRQFRDVSTASTPQGCSKGPSNAVVYYYNYTLAPRELVIDWSFNWENTQEECGAQFPDYYKEYPSSSEDRSKTIEIVVPIVVVGFCFVCCLTALVAVLLFVLVYTNSKQRKKRYLKEPDYEKYSIKPIFRRTAEIDLDFLAASLNLGTADKIERLEALQELLLEPEMAYQILQALTKAGLAREDAASCLVYIYYANGTFHELWRYAVSRELGNIETEATLFREDSALAAVWSAYNKLVGLRYLWFVLAETLYDIGVMSGDTNTMAVRKGSGSDEGTEMSLLQPKSFEVDKKKLSGSSHDRLVNTLHLKLAAQTTFHKIVTVPFPPELKELMREVRKKIEKNYEMLTHGVLANFVFLRFVCLALTMPNQFGLWKNNPNEKTLRFFVIMSKVIQNLGFGVEFEKEESMTDMNDFIRENREPMIEWLDTLSQYSEEDDEGAEEEQNNKGRDKKKNKVKISEEVRMNCVKWMYGEMYKNRQVMRRELEKKLEVDDWREAKRTLEEVGIFKIGGTGSSASGMSGNTLMSLKEGDGREWRRNAKTPVKSEEKSKAVALSENRERSVTVEHTEESHSGSGEDT